MVTHVYGDDALNAKLTKRTIQTRVIRDAFEGNWTKYTAHINVVIL